MTITTPDLQRQNAWAKLGTPVASAGTASEALETARLGAWNLRKAPIYAQDGEGLLEVPGRVGVVRDSPDGPKVLGDVGSTYHIIHNEEYCAILDAIVDQTGAAFEYAGSFDQDRKVFVTIRLPEAHLVGEDPVQEYLAAVGSHDGSMSLNLLTTPVRVDCENVLNMAFKSRTGLVRVRHTSGAKDMSSAEASNALYAVKAYLKDFHTVSRQLARKKMSSKTFRSLAGEALGLDEESMSSLTLDRTREKVDQIVDLFENSPTNEKIRGTAWAGLNALTEWFDHMSPTRGSEPYQARAVKSLLDPSFKNHALRTVAGDSR